MNPIVIDTQSKAQDTKQLPGTASANLSYQLVSAATVVLPTLGTVYAMWLWWHYGIHAVDIALLVFMYVVTILGVELGYHRYLTHRSMKTSPFFRAVLVIVGCMAAHGPPIWWVAIHRRHHMYSDHAEDPHSPSPRVHGASFGQRLAGAWHAHIAWMFNPECTAAHASRYAQDLFADRRIWWIDRFYWGWVLLGLAIPTVLGGLLTASWSGAWTGFIWGGLVRMFLGQHALWWGIVTVCHLFGTRPFVSNDDSRNNVIVAIIFLGDGWHNNHHAFPTSAKVGLRWWEIDMTWWVVSVLKRVGLVWDVKVPSRASIDSKRAIPRGN
ncbi:MAG: fatty acid desaturase [Gammaproteobacteria bacterium]|nr:fatty acid desaturase [Gammaproteobacteria bacterium]